MLAAIASASCFIYYNLKPIQYWIKLSQVGSEHVLARPSSTSFVSYFRQGGFSQLQWFNEGGRILTSHSYSSDWFPVGIEATGKVLFERISGAYANAEQGGGVVPIGELTQPVARYDCGYLVRSYGNCHVVWGPDNRATVLRRSPGSILGPIDPNSKSIFMLRRSNKRGALRYYWEITSLGSSRPTRRLICPGIDRQLVPAPSKPSVRLAGSDHLLFFVPTVDLRKKAVVAIPYAQDHDPGNIGLTLISFDTRNKTVWPIIKVSLPKLNLSEDIGYQEFLSDIAVFRSRSVAFILGDDVIVCRLNKGLTGLEPLVSLF